MVSPVAALAPVFDELEIADELFELRRLPIARKRREPDRGHERAVQVDEGPPQRGARDRVVAEVCSVPGENHQSSWVLVGGVCESTCEQRTCSRRIVENFGDLVE